MRSYGKILHVLCGFAAAFVLIGPVYAGDQREPHVRGNVPCSQERGQDLGICEVVVTRGSGGDTTIMATFVNGFSRTLTFIHGEFVFANSTMSGVGNDIDWHLDDGIHVVRVDDQRFLLPDALIFAE